MARRRAHYRDRHRIKVYQDSPFLDLPGEIRTLIYRAALYRAAPIDLWPSDFVLAPAEDPTLAARIAKAEAEPGIHDERYRHQKDLEYVRKQMATGLLATCTQVFKEAQHIFWHENTFRFSGDREYFGARRFLGSIGPRAISQLRTLELFVPVAWGAYLHNKSTDDGFAREAKNHPKMHMVKTTKKTNPKWVSGYDFFESNIGYTLTLLEPVRGSIELKFIVPPGWGIDSVSTEWNERSRKWDKDVGILEPTERALRKFARRTSFIFEHDAVVMDGELLDHVLAKGIDFICLAGSSMSEDPDQPPVQIEETKRWTDPNLYLDILTSVSELFQEPTSIPSVPCCGGKATKFAGKKRTERRLRGFGGCIFKQVDGIDCEGCDKTLLHLHNKHLYRCANCGFQSSHYSENWRLVCILRKAKRAEERGEFTNARMYEGLYLPPPVTT